jgi:hypothetical protein
MQKEINQYDISNQIDHMESIEKSEEILNFLRSNPSELDNIKPKSLILKFIEKLESKMLFERVYDLGTILLSTPNVSNYDYEINKSILMLQTHQKFEQIFNMFFTMSEIGKTISHQVLLDFINSLHTSKLTKHYSERCLELFLKLLGLGYDFNQSFWRTLFDVFKIQNIKYSNDIVIYYPMKVS